MSTSTDSSAATAPLSFPLPPPFDSSPPSAFTLIAQGAEARLYRTHFWSPAQPCALKVRPPKPWRHPQLDRRLTRARILAEARVLARCRRAGVCVPAVFAVDWDAGWTACEWVAGGTVKEAVRAWSARGSAAPAAAAGDVSGSERRAGAETVEAGSGMGSGGSSSISIAAHDGDLRDLLRRIGAAVGMLHAAGIVHGDLTTSNMILRPVGQEGSSVERGGDEEGEKSDAGLAGEIVLIDFGLAVQATQDEDRAVDLYVLERAFGSTHPREEAAFGEVLAAYERCYKGAKATLRKLEDVRMRGRKKSMIG